MKIQCLSNNPSLQLVEIGCESCSLSGYQPAVYLANESQSEAVCRAIHSLSASIEHMRIDHRRADVFVPEQLLNRPDVVAILKQMGGKGMPEGVTTGRLGDPGCPHGLSDRSLQDGFVEMMPLLLAGLPILIEL